MAAPNRPAIKPKRPPAIPIQIGNVKINRRISNTEVAEELELRDPIDFVLPIHTKMYAEIGMSSICSEWWIYERLKSNTVEK